MERVIAALRNQDKANIIPREGPAGTGT